MTFMHLRDQGLPKHALGERRFDLVTAENIRDALRAHGSQTVAQAMEHQRVSLQVALRVLAAPSRRREQQKAPAATLAQSLVDTQPTDLADFATLPA